MGFLENEGSWSLSFAGSGYLGLYHVGVTQCLHQRAPHLLKGARRIYGSSSGVLNAVSIICGMSTDYCCSSLLGLVKQLQQLSLGILHPAYAPIEYIKQQLKDALPSNGHILATQRLGISLTHWPDGRNYIVTDFATRDELIQALVCSLYLPFYCGVIPPEFRGEVVADNCRQGYLDALRFLETRGLTKEPVLWTLVSKEPPAPAEGTKGAGQDRGQQAALSISWDVPHVLVKDVPDFEQLAPELEAGLKKACRRDQGPWTRFRCSVPGRALTYLMLPCTLPFEYIYFRSRRLVVWLPEVPADLCWMQGLLKDVTLELYTRVRDQLLRPGSLLVPSIMDSDPLQPGAAAPVDLAMEFGTTHQACGAPGRAKPVTGLS
ncbi:patatin-like phospholipase domain-containing protein 5 isoform X3 [Castor canadensis]|uniref:Patatin-like phospholipase domain-containing protein 5 isoform X3 n=1 Tax=Castor canadensis TaxID=51338 RepID=A0AC58NGN2_CASCN